MLAQVGFNKEMQRYQSQYWYWASYLRILVLELEKNTQDLILSNSFWPQPAAQLPASFTVLQFSVSWVVHLSR